MDIFVLCISFGFTAWLIYFAIQQSAKERKDYLKKNPPKPKPEPKPKEKYVLKLNESGGEIGCFTVIALIIAGMVIIFFRKQLLYEFFQKIL